MRTIVLFLFLAATACGAVSPELRVSASGLRAESYGWACPCGDHRFAVLGRDFQRTRLRCLGCGREWVVTDREVPR